MKRILEQVDADLFVAAVIAMLIFLIVATLVFNEALNDYNERLKYESCLSKAIDVKDCSGGTK